MTLSIYRRVFHPHIVKDVLALTYNCGMYDYSGEWAFKVGVPAKSGIAGTLMAIIPNKMGVAVYSPLINAQGNSVRAIEFCERLVKHFHLSIFDDLANMYVSAVRGGGD